MKTTSLGTYFPTRHQNHNSFLSQMILQLKSKSPRAVAYFAKAILYRTAQYNNLLVMAIPSHDPANVNGITMVARRLTTLSGKFIDGTNAITRISPADSFCKTGNRSASVLLKTIAVNQNTVKGKVVLLLDDVSSTGTSI